MRVSQSQSEFQQLSSREYPTLLFLLDHSWNSDWNRDIDEGISVPTMIQQEEGRGYLSFNYDVVESISLPLPVN